MAKTKNYIVYPATREEFNRLQSEYEWLGRETKSEVTPEGPRLVILALPSVSKKKKKADRKQRRKTQRDEE